ncbi:MAG: hypothetical protein R3Y35_07470 [Clostridia bacterium]
MTYEQEMYSGKGSDRYTPKQEIAIKEAKAEGINVLPYINNHFDYEMIKEIEKGIKVGINVELYTKYTRKEENPYSGSIALRPRYNSEQMKQIRLGLENEIRVSAYMSTFEDGTPKLTASEMKTIRLQLQELLSKERHKPNSVLTQLSITKAQTSNSTKNKSKNNIER